jgi:DNA-binding transcriptional LysR family regulator
MDQVRSLRVFVQVVAAGSFAGAARVLDMAPAGVTRAVAELEAHLGARLLNRTTRSLALTEIGEAYLDRARQMLTELDEADALAGAQTQRPEGVLRVLCPPAFAVHQLALKLPAFRAQYPGIALELSTPGPVEAADENFDISILSLGAQPLQGDFVARPLAQSSFVLCAAPAYLAQRGRPAEPEDLAAHDGVLPAVAAVRRELTLYRQVPDDREGAVNKVSLRLPRPAVSTSQIDMMLAAALAGLGVVGLPSFVAAEALRTGRLERVLPDWRGATLRLYVAMPARRHVPARTRVFAEFLMRTFGGEPRDPWLEVTPAGIARSDGFA